MSENNYEEVVAETFDKGNNNDSLSYIENDLSGFMPSGEVNHKSLWRYIVLIIIYLFFTTGILGDSIRMVGDQAFRNNETFIQEIDSNYASYYFTRASINGLGFIHIEQYEQYLEDEGVKLLAVYLEDNYVLVMNTYNGTLSNIGSNTWFVYVETDENSILSNYQLTPTAFNMITNRHSDYLKWNQTDEFIDFYISSDSIPSFFNEEDLTLDTHAILTIDTPIRTGLYISFISFVVYFIIAAVMIVVAFPILVNDLKPLFKVGVGKFFNELIVATGIFFAFTIGGNILRSFLHRIFQYSPQSSVNQFTIEFIASSGGLALTLLITTAVLIGPIVEELIFRKTIFNFFNNVRVGLVVSSILFGLIHMTSELAAGNFVGFFFGMIPYLISGFAFGFIYMRYKTNIWIPTLIHMITNLIAFIL